nr:hypothetical protein CFP56_75858 [Quercus suber]
MDRYSRATCRCFIADQLMRQIDGCAIRVVCSVYRSISSSTFVSKLATGDDLLEKDKRRLAALPKPKSHELIYERASFVPVRRPSTQTSLYGQPSSPATSSRNHISARCYHSSRLSSYVSQPDSEEDDCVAAYVQRQMIPHGLMESNQSPLTEGNTTTQVHARTRLVRTRLVDGHRNGPPSNPCKAVADLVSNQPWNCNPPSHPYDDVYTTHRLFHPGNVIEMQDDTENIAACHGSQHPASMMLCFAAT